MLRIVLTQGLDGRDKIEDVTDSITGLNLNSNVSLPLDVSELLRRQIDGNRQRLYFESLHLPTTRITP